MKRNNSHIVLLTAVFLLLFSGAFITDALCKLEIIDYASNLSHQHDDGHHQQKNTAHEHDTDHHDDSEPCCDEISSTLESSLFSSQLTTSAPQVKYFLLKTIDFSLKSSFKSVKAQSIYHEYDSPPPLNGMQIRVVLQSFLN